MLDSATKTIEPSDSTNSENSITAKIYALRCFEESPIEILSRSTREALLDSLCNIDAGAVPNVGLMVKLMRRPNASAKLVSPSVSNGDGIWLMVKVN